MRTLAEFRRISFGSLSVQIRGRIVAKAYLCRLLTGVSRLERLRNGVAQCSLTGNDVGKICVRRPASQATAAALA
jgi:hypothetical protein